FTAQPRSNSRKEIAEGLAIDATAGGGIRQRRQLKRIPVGVPAGIYRRQRVGRDGRVQSQTGGRRGGIGIVVRKERRATRRSGCRRSGSRLQNVVDGVRQRFRKR